MAKRFKLKFSRVIPSFQLCRSKKQSKLPEAPVPVIHRLSPVNPKALDISYPNLNFPALASVDPIDVARNITGLNPETTLVVVVSKTFTTAETMLNARTLREWISSALGPSAVAKHMVAVSTNLTLVEKFGIDPNNAFAFWDWVGGRYSGKFLLNVPLFLSLQCRWSVAFISAVRFPNSRKVCSIFVTGRLLMGASSIDQHFRSAPFEKNIPVI
ncbi:hypothetical protein DITRI_Ditri03aG0204400 [Diplodiscus trichospermus]